jgi:hypothetical protein
MGGGTVKRFDDPDETRDLGKGTGQIVHLAGATAARVTFEPGWQWANDIKPLVGGESCQAHHVGYSLSGSLHLVTDDGDEMDINAGDVYEILPGHNAWVNGDEAFQGLEFQSQTAQSYAKP